jgi:hypothetical protein
LHNLLRLLVDRPRSLDRFGYVRSNGDRRRVQRERKRRDEGGRALDRSRVDYRHSSSTLECFRMGDLPLLDPFCHVGNRELLGGEYCRVGRAVEGKKVGTVEPVRDYDRLQVGGLAVVEV